MKQLNEYQQREENKYSVSAEKLHMIVEELNKIDMGDVAEWAMEPRNNDLDYTPRFIMISAKHPLGENGQYQIMCERDGYGNRDRWEFRACGWPVYIDENGAAKTIHPSDLWNPKANAPVTTAGQNREPKAIARQIASKILPDYVQIYQRCWNRAEEWQAHADKTGGALSRLAAACQDEEKFRGHKQRTFYVRNMAGNAKRVEFRSEGDVEMNFTTDEAIAVIALLRQLRGES